MALLESSLHLQVCDAYCCHLCLQSDYVPACRSTLAQVLLVRYVAQVISESGTRQSGESGSFYDFLESCLRHKNDMVTVEAARAICNMKDVTTRELTPAVTVLQLMLSSSKPVVRYSDLMARSCSPHSMQGLTCSLTMLGLA